MKMLLVDDDAFLRDMYATKFTEAGDEVETTDSPERALSKLEGDEFDVVILDMVMPGMTGVELVKKIKSNPDHSELKCIVLSNQGEETDIKAATKAGAVGYIIKAELIPSEVVKKVHEIAP